MFHWSACTEKHHYPLKGLEPTPVMVMLGLPTKIVSFETLITNIITKRCQRKLTYCEVIWNYKVTWDKRQHSY